MFQSCNLTNRVNNPVRKEVQRHLEAMLPPSSFDAARLVSDTWLSNEEYSRQTNSLIPKAPITIGCLST